MDRHEPASRQDTPYADPPPPLPEARGGNVAIFFGVLSILLVVTIGMLVDYSRFWRAQTDLQSRLDLALAAGALEERAMRVPTAESLFDRTVTGSTTKVALRRFSSEQDGLSGTVAATVPTTLSTIVGIPSFRVTASGRAAVPTDGR